MFPELTPLSQAPLFLQLRETPPASLESLLSRTAAAAASRMPIRAETQTTTERYNHLPKVIRIKPYVVLDTLPRNLANALNGLRALEIRIGEVFWMQMMNDIIDLNRLFPAEQTDKVSLTISFLISIARMADTIIESENSEEVALNVVESIENVIPPVAMCLKNEWLEKSAQLEALANRLPSSKSTLAKDKLFGLAQQITFLADLSQNPKALFDFIDCSTMHVTQSQDFPRKNSQDWLRFMLQSFGTIRSSFQKNRLFWSRTESQTSHLDSKTAFAKIQRFIENRLSQAPLTENSLFQMMEIVQPYTIYLGNMHSRATQLAHSADAKTSTALLGFFPDLFQYLSKKMDLNPIYKIQLMAHCNTVTHNYLDLHKSLLFMGEAAAFAALNEKAAARGFELERQKIKEVIQHTEEILDFFNSTNEDAKSVSVLTSGAFRISFTDLVNHLEGCTTLLSDLLEHEKEPGQAVLYSLYDLYQTSNKTIVMGIDEGLLMLQRELLTLQKHQSASNSAILEPASLQVSNEEIMSYIQVIAGFTEILDQKTPALNKLMKEIFGMEESKNTHSSTRKKSSKSKKKAQRPKPKAQQKKTENQTQPLKIVPSIDKTDELPETLLEKEDAPAAPMPENKIASALQKSETTEALTTNLIRAAAQFRQSVEDFNQKTVNDHEMLSARNVKWRTLCDELVKAGWNLIRSTGSHRQFAHPLAKEVGLAVVPVNSKNSLSTGVVRNVRGRIQEAHDALDGKTEL
jgi:predicted RNA binding protein YcfA (HicA-like mRNA interferase family)